MSRIGSLIFALYLLLGSYAFACPKPAISESLQSAIEKVFSTQGVWSGFKPQSLKLVIGYGDANRALLFNFSHEDLKPVSSQVSFCDDQSKWSVLKLNKVPHPSNGIYEPQMPNPKGSELEVLASRVGTPVLFISSTARVGDVVFEPEEIAGIAIHEMFHFAHQFFGKFKMDEGFERTFLDRCEKNPVWLNQIQQEFARWRSVLENWERLSDSDLRKTVTSILKLRHVSGDAEVTYCWNATRFWERIEGTASFVEKESAKNANFLTVSQIRAELLKSIDSNSRSVCTGCPDSGSGKIIQNYFYGTGTLILSALSRLSGSTAFQEEIANGVTPADAFLGAFGD